MDPFEPYKCPQCSAELEDLTLHETMVHYQESNPKTGKIQSEIEPSDETTPYFVCQRCGKYIDYDVIPDEFREIVDEWVAHADKSEKKIKEQKATDTEARREKARQKKKANLDALRQQYEQDTGFLPPMPKK